MSVPLLQQRCVETKLSAQVPQDPEHIVRRAAVSGFSLLSGPEDSLVVLDRVRDSDVEVRRAALASALQLYQLASSECQQGWLEEFARFALDRLQRDPDCEVRVGAMECLHFLVTAAHGRRLILVMADTLQMVLKEKHLELRLAAAKCLAKVSHPAFQTAAETGMLDLDLRVQSLSIAALLKMGKVSEKCRRFYATAALKHLASSSREVRGEAAGILMLVGKTNETSMDAKILSSLLARLSDAPDVSIAAVDALAVCAPRGHSEVLASLSRLFTGTADEVVRCAAARAMATIARPGDEAVLSALNLGLAGSSQVISATIRAIGMVSRRGDPAILALLVDLLPRLDKDGVRESLLALTRITLRRGSSVVSACILRILGQSGPDLQLACVQALSSVARKGDLRVVETLRALLTSTDASLREAAASALAELGKRGDAATICSLLRLVSGAATAHEETRVRISAIRAVAFLANTPETDDRKRRKPSDATAIAAMVDCLQDAADPLALFSLLKSFPFLEALALA